MRMDILSHGFPGKMLDGYMGWSSVVLVRSGGTNILFDTGGIDKRVDLCPALREAGVEPENVHCLVLSHFHADHVFNYDWFPEAKILMHPDEITYARQGRDPWQPPAMMAAIEASGRLRGVSEGESPAPGVTMIHLPGHTPGCIGLVLEDASMPVTVLAGDAVKTLYEMANGKAPMTLDPRQTLRSVQKVRAVAKRVVPGHDRLLALEDDRVTALIPARKTIVVPPGVADPDAARRLELTLEQTWLPFGKDV